VSTGAGPLLPPPLRIALGEYDTGWHDPERSLARAGEVVERAAGAGAELVVLPEMTATGFTMDSVRYAETLDGRSAAALSRLARTHGVHLLAGLATRAPHGSAERYYNSALVYAPDGSLLAEYRKQRLFGFAGETDAYSPGENAVIVTIGGVRVAPFICFDLRFPELFRAVAAGTDAIVVIANWPAARRSHWDVLVRARAIENQCCVIAVNRIGVGGGVDYDGGSVAWDAWGERLAAAGAAPQEVACVDVDPGVVARVRSLYPFLSAGGR
jgi:omega-amidase